MLVLPLGMMIAMVAFVHVSVPSYVAITGEEFSRSAPINLHHSRLVKQSTNATGLVGDDEARYIDVKLLGIIPLKRVRVELLPFDKVIPGGQLLGLRAKIEEIKTEDGRSKLETTGLGTLTFVNPENLNFASLGHKFSDYETGQTVSVKGGRVYKNNVVGIDKSKVKKVGTYKSGVRSGKGLDADGEIHYGNAFGVFGCLRPDSELGKAEVLSLTSRYNVVPGRAKLRTTLDNEVREFDIEIVKTKFQKKPNAKSLVVRIVDKELLEKTGGIIHGMSGSPIIQNGRVVGALTHVMLNNPAMGYGVYIDFMMDGINLP